MTVLNSPVSLEELKVHELTFVDQMTRKLLVGWCDQWLEERIGPGFQDPNKHLSMPTEPLPNPSIYLEHAKKKGWVSQDGKKILAAGWQTASRFLKR